MWYIDEKIVNKSVIHGILQLIESIMIENALFEICNLANAQNSLWCENTDCLLKAVLVFAEFNPTINAEV